MNGSLIERAFATAGKPWYWFFLLTGFAFIILLVCMGVHLFRKDMDKPGNLVGVILNIVLIVIPVTVFWDPIFTTFVACRVRGRHKRRRDVLINSTKHVKTDHHGYTVVGTADGRKEVDYECKHVKFGWRRKRHGRA